MATFNYVVTAHKPTNVTHSLVACFTGPNTLNLIVSRCTRIEIYALEAQGLQLVLDVPLYCRIATMELWRPAGRTTDRLFISTERYEFCILAYDERRGEIVTEARGNVADRIGRPADAGQICAIEPESRMIGLHLYVYPPLLTALDRVASPPHLFVWPGTWQVRRPPQGDPSDRLGHPHAGVVQHPPRGTPGDRSRLLARAAQAHHRPPLPG